jgi:hypothetical protein
MEGKTNGDRNPDTHLEQDICIHIFAVSSAMVGVCLTVIGLIRVVITLGRADTLAMTFWPATPVFDFLPAVLLGAAFAVSSPNASSGKDRRWNLHPSHDRDGDHLRLDHLHHLCSGSNRSWLK